MFMLIRCRLVMAQLIIYVTCNQKSGFSMEILFVCPHITLIETKQFVHQFTTLRSAEEFSKRLKLEN